MRKLLRFSLLNARIRKLSISLVARGCQLSFITLLLCVAFTYGQVDGPNPNTDSGIMPYQSLRGGDIDTVMNPSDLDMWGLGKLYSLPG